MRISRWGGWRLWHAHRLKALINWYFFFLLGPAFAGLCVCVCVGIRNRPPQLTHKQLGSGRGNATALCTYVHNALLQGTWDSREKANQLIPRIENSFSFSPNFFFQKFFFWVRTYCTVTYPYFPTVATPSSGRGRGAKRQEGEANSKKMLFGQTKETGTCPVGSGGSDFSFG